MGALAALVYLIVGIEALNQGHPHEDAYIIFKYAQNLAAGDGIVFNVGGPPAEGTTPFLWLILIASGVRLGADPAVAAAVWSAVGAGLAAALLCRAVWRATAAAPTDRWIRAVVVALPVAIVLWGPAIGSLYGFGGMLYAAMALAALVVYCEDRPERVHWLPALGLAIALFRPDGVLIGATFTVLGLLQARSHGVARRYVRVALACALVGAVYFVARFAYFGLPLPLPLYVKSRGSGLLGLENNLSWLESGQHPLLLIGAIALLAIALGSARRRERRHLLLGLLPSVILFAALARGQQSQDVYFRFQAPITMALVFATVQLAFWNVERRQAPWIRRAFVVAAAVAIVPGLRGGAEQLRARFDNHPPTYVDTFAVIFGDATNEGDRVAVTESGRIPYWSSARFEDFVGLNSPRAATELPSRAYVEEFDPDVVMFHHASLLDPERLAEAGSAPPRVLSITPDTLAGAVKAEYRELFDGGVPDYEAAVEDGIRPVVAAAAALAGFLSERSDYEIIAVDQWGRGRYEHIYGFRKSWSPRLALVQALEKTIDLDPRWTYREIVRGEHQTELRELLPERP